MMYNFFPRKQLYSLSFSNGPYCFMGEKSPSTHTIQFYTPQNTRESTMTVWQGYRI